MKKYKSTPKFKKSEDESIFWQEHDSTDYIDWSKAKNGRFPNLKPSTKTISLRLSESLLNDLKIEANKKDIPYQSLMKILLTDAVHHMRE